MIAIAVWVRRSRRRPGRALKSGERNAIAERDRVPQELIPFLNVVYHWGAVESDLQRYRLANQAESRPHLLQELKEFNDAWTPELLKCHSDWADAISLTENETVARFYFTFLLLDELQFKFPRDENANPVAEFMNTLKSPGRARYWACRMLPDYGEEAKAAIPLLEETLNDSDPAIRIWAHYALARLTENEAGHRTSMMQIDQDHRFSDIQLEIVSALEVLDRPPEQHRVEAICSFCIRDEIRQILRLVPITHVDGLDHNGASPLSYAVGNGHTEAAQILLAHGADPNLPTRSGETYLHVAATWRDNAEMINLLVRHGANVMARDSRGATPLDRARESRRRSNVKLLKSLHRKSP